MLCAGLLLVDIRNSFCCVVSLCSAHKTIAPFGRCQQIRATYHKFVDFHYQTCGGLHNTASPSTPMLAYSPARTVHSSSNTHQQEAIPIMSTPQTYRWGIMATGRIARQFANDLKTHVPDARITAVGSRSAETAARFAQDFDIPNAHDSYDAVANDPDVDIVYVGTPNNLHYDNVKASLEAGKAVLCEKPFALNARQAEELVDLSQRKNVFMMEAMWTRFLPAHKAMFEFVQHGGIGEVRMVQASFGFRAAYDPTSRLFDPTLGGGGLLDVGVYTLAFAVRYLGMPNSITGHADIGATGVDEQAGYILGYPSGAMAVLTCGVRTQMTNEARLFGTKGRIVMHERFHEGTDYTVFDSDGGQSTQHIPLQESGLQYQAIEVQRCLREGLVQSPAMSHDDTLAIMRIMDTLRQQWGIRYPGE